MAYMKRWECCFDLWQQADYEHVGVADAHLGFHLTRIIEQVNPKILVIRRDIDQVKASLQRMGIQNTAYCDALSEAINKFSTHPSIAWVSFEGLKSFPIIAQCLSHLMPEGAIDESRIRPLMDLNIQENMDLVWQRALESRSIANQILGIESMPGMNSYQ